MVGEPFAQDVDVGAVALVVGRVGLGDPDDVAGLDLVGVREAEDAQLLLALLDELLIGGVPHVVVLEHEVLEPEARVAVLHHERRPGTEVLDAADLDVGAVDVDPVVVEGVGAGDDECDGEEVAELEALGRSHDALGHGRVHGQQQVGHRHRTDDVLGGVGGSGTAGLGGDRDGLAVGVGDLDDLGLHEHLRALRLHELGAPLPHHAGPELGVLELLDERRDLLLVPLGEEGVDDGARQGEVLDPLRRPVGGHRADGHTPHLLGVGLEERAVEAPAEAGHEPALVVGLVLGRTDAGHRVAADALDGLDGTEVAQRVECLERVVEVLALVEDAALAGAEEEVAVGQDLVPQGLDLGHLREEPVAADVEPPAVALDGAADAADDVVALEDGGRASAFAEFVGGREARRTGSDDDDPCGCVG